MTGKNDPDTMLMLSQGFEGFVTEKNCSIVLTTYQAGRLFFIGSKPGGGIRAHERLVEQAQGL